MDLIGLTGGIGSGKSTVSGFLRELGARVIDADEGARAVVEPGTAGFAAVVTLVAVGASALLLLGLPPATRAAGGEEQPAGIAQQLGAALAGAVLLVLLYVAFNGHYFGGATFTGQFNAAALGRLLAGRDALALEAVAAALLVAGAVGGRILRSRAR